MGVRPFQESLHKSRPMGDHVKGPFPMPLLEPLPQDRGRQRCASGVLRDKALKGAQDMSVNSTCLAMSKALSPQEAFDSLCVFGG